MIVPLHKYLIMGASAEIDRFFMLAQRAGIMEFIGLSNKKALEMPEEAKTIVSAVKILRVHTLEQQAPFYPAMHPLTFAEQVLNLKQEHEKLFEEQRILKAEIARVAPFGDFSRNQLDHLEVDAKRVFQFFCMKSELAREISLPSEVIYISSDYELDYFVAINKEKTSYPKMIEITIERPIGELRQRGEHVALLIAKLEQEIHDRAKALPFLEQGLLEYLDDYHLSMAKHDIARPLGESLFAIEAWVPETKIASLKALLSNLDVFAEEIAIEQKDRIPTCQENKGAGKIGEDLVNIYETPSWTDKDPSLWVLGFFSLFFAMIVSDAGYGLIYLLIAFIMKYKWKKASGAFRRFIKLTFILSTASILWGVATGSFFGIEISPQNPLKKFSLLHSIAAKKAEYHREQKDAVYEEYLKKFPQVASATNGREFLLDASRKVDGKIEYVAMDDFYDDILLELSLLVGAIHIASSFIRYLGRNWTGIGWLFFMVGGYLYFPSFLDATSILNFMGVISKETAYKIGPPILYIGLTLVFLIALLQKKKWGAFHELTNAIQVFGDVLSYLRLYALALAGMMMATTFNDLGVKVGIFAGFFVILLGHINNLVLTIQSAVIHGLRLNFLEWYHYSFEGGGRPFNPLRIRKNK